jgi:hypothetical protein
MQQNITSYPSAYELTQLLEEYPAGCDSDFDAEHEELERQFAELRMTFDHN